VNARDIQDVLLAHHPGANVVTLNAGWVKGESSERPRRELLVYLVEIGEDDEQVGSERCVDLALDPTIGTWMEEAAAPAPGRVTLDLGIEDTLPLNEVTPEVLVGMWRDLLCASGPFLKRLSGWRW
jgi:hypothetical protein